MIYKEYYKSPLGFLEIIADDKYLLAINFVKNKKNKKSNALVKECVAELKEYFKGRRKIFDLPIKISGSPWQIRTCFELTKIPYGAVVSYQDLAAMSGNIKAARSVGMAVHKNRIPIIIPCHRVLGSRGQLVGYAAGLSKKKYLLSLENNDNL